VVDRQQVNICRDCQRAVEAQANMLCNSGSERLVFIASLARRFKIKARNEIDGTLSPGIFAALLGLRE
jgi:hypothetical protein